MNKQAKSQEDDENFEFDSFLSSWKIDKNQKESFGFGSGFFDRMSNFDSSQISENSLKFSNNAQSNKQLNGFSNNGNQMEMISLSDMLKTNCSHQQLNRSLGNMAVFDKVTTRRRNINGEREMGDDGLEMVSNRKLQNRANSKRARERKKEEFQQMKNTINELEIENRTLRQSIERQYQKKKLKQGRKYCRKCQSQMKDSSEEQDNQHKQKNNSHDSSLAQCKWASKGKDQNNFLEKQYIRIFLSNQQKDQIKNKRKKYGYEKSEDKDYKQFQRWVEGEGKKIWQRGTQYIEQKQKYSKFENQNESNMQLQFEQMDFLNKKSSKNKKQKKNQREQAWMGKVWVALSIIMMVLGVQLHGLEGSGQKSIRVNQVEAKNWLSDFQNPQKEELTIKIKTKIPNAFIENQKQLSQSHIKWKEKWDWENYKQNGAESMEEQIKQRRGRTRKSLNQNSHDKSATSWLQSVRFEAQSSYSRSMEEEEQESEFKIDKDLLFSIQAEFDDIGMYI